MRVSSRQLVVGNKYLLPDNSISILKEKMYDKNELVFDNGDSYNFDVTIRKVEPTMVKSEKFFRITKENLDLINNPPEEFTYDIYEKAYEILKNNVIPKEKV